MVGGSLLLLGPHTFLSQLVTSPGAHCCLWGWPAHARGWEGVLAAGFLPGQSLYWQERAGPLTQEVLGVRSGRGIPEAGLARPPTPPALPAGAPDRAEEWLGQTCTGASQNKGSSGLVPELINYAQEKKTTTKNQHQSPSIQGHRSRRWGWFPADIQQRPWDRLQGTKFEIVSLSSWLRLNIKL